MLTVAAFYHFTRFGAPEKFRGPLLERCRAEGIHGTILLAPEGINGTVAGPQAGIERLLADIREMPGCAQLEHKQSTASEPPFARMKVRLKREIVTMGQPDVNPQSAVGSYVDPKDWNALVDDPDVVLIDTRNDYEVEIGTFAGAVDPKTASFGEFPEWWKANAEAFRGKKVAMFCTGGIRCEKSTNYLMGQGVKDVYHLKGGILKYLEEVPGDDSRWRGSCFVFDGRVSVDHDLREGPHVMCHACRKPILPEDRNRPEYESGVACHHCASRTSERDKTRYRERQKQIDLARARGLRHIGTEDIVK